MNTVSENGSFLDRHHYLLRRLHSLTGIMPIGMFLVMHLTTNSSIVWGVLNGFGRRPLKRLLTRGGADELRVDTQESTPAVRAEAGV